MRTSINKTDTAFELVLKRNDGKFAKVPLSKDDMILLHSDIIKAMPELTVPKIVQVGIEKLYELTHKKENENEIQRKEQGTQEKH